MSTNHYSFAKMSSSIKKSFERSRNKNKSPSQHSSQSYQSNSSNDHPQSLSSSHQDKSSLNQNGRWTLEEHHLFQKGLHLYGKDWKLIAQLVKTRNSSQVRSHAQKYFYRIEKQESKKVPNGLLQSARSLRKRDTLSLKSYSKSHDFPMTPSNKKKAEQFSTKSNKVHSTIEKSSSQNKSIKKSLNNSLQNSECKIKEKKYSFADRHAIETLDKKNVMQKCIQQFSKLQEENTDQYLKILEKIPGHIILPISYFTQFVLPALFQKGLKLENLIEGKIEQKIQDQDCFCKIYKRQKKLISKTKSKKLNFNHGINTKQNIDIIQQNLEEQDDSKLSPQASEQFKFGTNLSAFKYLNQSNSQK